VEEGKAKPRIALLSNKIFVEKCCVICGEPFETGEILPELYDEDGRLIGYVCDGCAYEPQSYTSKLRAQAEDLENLVNGLQNSAVRLRQLADTGIQPPDADYRLELESLIAVGDSKETEKLNAVEQKKDLPAENLKGKKFLALPGTNRARSWFSFLRGTGSCGLHRLGKGKVVRSSVMSLLTVPRDTSGPGDYFAQVELEAGTTSLAFNCHNIPK
jgi:hypothetical protein